MCHCQPDWSQRSQIRTPEGPCRASVAHFASQNDPKRAHAEVVCCGTSVCDLSFSILYSLLRSPVRAEIGDKCETFGDTDFDHQAWQMSASWSAECWRVGHRMRRHDNLDDLREPKHRRRRSRLSFSTTGGFRELPGSPTGLASCSGSFVQTQDHSRDQPSLAQGRLCAFVPIFGYLAVSGHLLPGVRR